MARKAKLLTDLKSEVNQSQKRICNIAKKMVQQEFVSFFSKHKDIKGVRWVQTNAYDTEEKIRIEDVEYRFKSHVSDGYAPSLFDSGFDRQDNGWISPWNDSRIEKPDVLDALTILEEKINDSKDLLAYAFGYNSRITVSHLSVSVEDHT